MYEPGETVLIRGRVTDDGRCLLLAPGVEVALTAGIHIACDVPFIPEAAPGSGIVLFAHSEAAAFALVDALADSVIYTARKL